VGPGVWPVLAGLFLIITGQSLEILIERKSFRPTTLRVRPGKASVLSGTTIRLCGLALIYLFFLSPNFL
jgi:hypothetical protein